MGTFLDTLAARDETRERTELLLLERENQQLAALQAAESARSMLEQFDPWASSDPYAGGSRAGLGPATNDLFFSQGLGTHTARPGSRQHGDLPPFYRTEQQHWEIVDVARVLEAMCPTAANILDVLTQFAVFTGFEYTVVPKKTADDGKPERRTKGDPDEIRQNVANSAGIRWAKDVQRRLDRWIKEVDWYRWECEIFRRTRRDGEAFVILDDDDPTSDGLPSLRSVEPEQVKEPQEPSSLNQRLGIGSDESWKYGILTSRENTSIPLKYWVVTQYSGSRNMGQMYDADEVFHLKTEWVDRQAKRGVSDFYSVANDLPGVKKLLRNLREGATVQASIAWIREHPPLMLPSQMGGAGLAPDNVTRAGDKVSSVNMQGPTILDVMNGMKYIGGPLGGSGAHLVLIEVLQAALRNIGSRWQFPEGLISGDASNANLASALVAEGPFARGMEMRQWHYRNAYARLLERVLDRASVMGRTGPARENLWEQLELSVECKPVIARKMAEETDRCAVLSARGILSDQTWAAREDLDFEDEQANMEEHETQAAALAGQLAAESEAAVNGDDQGKIPKEPEGERVT